MKGDVEVGGGYVYYKHTNTWAEIIDDPEEGTHEPKFKEGDLVICRTHSHINDFTVVACRYEKSEDTFIYLISSPNFDGHIGNLVDVIYGKLPGTKTCWWGFEKELTLTSTDIPFETFAVSSTDGLQKTSFVDMLEDAQRSMYKQLSEMVVDSEINLMWGKDKTDLLVVPPLRVSRKNIKNSCTIKINK